MVKIALTPDWFLNNDVLISFVSFLVLGLFFLFSMKVYNLNKKKSILFLAFGFLLIAIGELSTVLTKFVLYYDTTITQEIGKIVITSKIVESVDIFYYLGFSFHKFFTLLGLYVIYKIPSTRKIFSGDLLLVLMLIIIVTLISKTFYQFYHLTAFILILLIINNYYKTYKKERSVNTKVLIGAFSLLALSQIIFIFSDFNYFYVAGQTIQLLTYITLFFLVVRIIQNGKKKK